MNYRDRIAAFDSELAAMDESLAKGRADFEARQKEFRALEAEAKAIDDKLQAKRAELKAIRQGQIAEAGRRDGSAANRAKLVDQIVRKLSTIDIPIAAEEARALFPKEFPAGSNPPATLPAGRLAVAKKIPVEDVITGAGKTINWDTLDAK